MSDVVVVLLLFVVAFAYANVGLGGGLLYFPLLSYFHPGWSPSTVVALTLLFSITTLAGSVRSHRSRGLIHGRYSLVLAVPMVAGAFAGARLTLGLTRPTVQILFSSVLLIIVFKMIVDQFRPTGGSGQREDDRPRRGIPLVGLIAAGAGFVSGSMGIGGGIIAVPLLIYAARLETRHAIGTASLALLMTAGSGLTTYLLSRGVHASPYLAGVLCISTFAGGSLGSKLGLSRLRSREVRALFIALLILAAVWNGLAALGP